MRKIVAAWMVCLFPTISVAQPADQTTSPPVILPIDVAAFILERISCDNLAAKNRNAASSQLEQKNAPLYVRCPVPMGTEILLRQKYSSNPTVIHALDDPKGAAGKDWTIYPPLIHQLPAQADKVQPR